MRQQWEAIFKDATLYIVQPSHEARVVGWSAPWFCEEGEVLTSGNTEVHATFDGELGDTVEDMSHLIWCLTC